MRDRLIELLREAKEHPEKTCPRYELPTCIGCDYNKGDECDKIARTADYLLANGVIVPPCKVGDTIYYNLGKNASLPFGTKRTLSLPVVAIANTEDKGLWFVRTEFSGSIADFKFSDFGKTVFLAREEAEVVLKAKEGADNV